MVVCCTEMSNAMDREMIVHTERYQIRDGSSYNDIDSEYFLRSGNADTGRCSYLALNFCPFCGRPLSRALWHAEKKK
ncbi:MAG: hypothetical protein ACREDR_05825 [Blastocatellia bacterium]